jgi:hypothetical protein
MTDDVVQLEAVPAERVATITRAAPGFGSALIGPVGAPISPEVLALLVAAGVPRRRSPSAPAARCTSPRPTGRRRSG